MLHSGFIAVHLGAGKHSSKNEGLYKKLCDSACQKGVSLLLDRSSALEVACQVLMLLEDSPLTNAGYGSNLNENGEVECDAGLMISTKYSNVMQFGAVSALKSVRNPIAVAKEIIHYQNEPRILGRIPPCFLVGEGAAEFACKRGISQVKNIDLISENALKKYVKYKERLEAYKNRPFKIEILPQPSNCQDTVGVICIDMKGNIASASSSGGIFLKLPGRVGQSSLFGCGCWAQHSNSCGVAVTTSGCGEQLIQTTLAKTIGQNILNNDNAAFSLKETMTNCFMNSEMLISEPDSIMGGVMVAHHEEDLVNFIVAFTTESMVVASMTTVQEKANYRLYRNSKTAKVDSCNTSLTMEGFIVKL